MADVPAYLTTLSDLALWLLERDVIDRDWQDKLVDAADAEQVMERLADVVGRFDGLTLADAPDHLARTLDEAERLRTILVAFGALGEDDHTTGPLDILEMLLPPAGGDA